MKKAWKIEIPDFDIAKISDTIAIKVNRADIHKLVQEKAFRLGYEWSETDGQFVVKNTNYQYLFLFEDGNISRSMHRSTFKDHHSPQISWQDFLELPEDLQTDDPDGQKISIDKNFDPFKKINNQFIQYTGRIKRPQKEMELEGTPIMDYSQLQDALLREFSIAFQVPISILKHEYNKEKTMKKITIAQKITEDNGYLTGVKEIKEYRNVSKTEAAIRYVKDCKLENSNNLVFNESIENWSEFT